MFSSRLEMRFREKNSGGISVYIIEITKVYSSEMSSPGCISTTERQGILDGEMLSQMLNVRETPEVNM